MCIKTWNDRGGVLKQLIWTFFLLVNEYSLGAEVHVFMIIEILSKEWWKQKLKEKYSITFALCDHATRLLHEHKAIIIAKSVFIIWSEPVSLSSFFSRETRLLFEPTSTKKNRSRTNQRQQRAIFTNSWILFLGVNKVNLIMYN